MSYGNKPPSPKPHFSSLSGGSKSSTTIRKSGGQSPNSFGDGGGKLSQKAPAISSHIDDHSFLSLSQQQEAATDVMRGLSPNVDPQNSFEPNSSTFSTSFAARSVVADAAAKHPIIHELIFQQKKQRAQEALTGKHGSSSSFGHAHAKEKNLFASADKQEKDRDRNISLVSSSSESTSLTADTGAADTDDCTNSDRTVTAGYMPSTHHNYPQGQPLSRDEASMSDDELLRQKSFYFERYLKLTQEMERRNALATHTFTHTHTHTTPLTVATAVSSHSGAVVANEKQPNPPPQPTKLLSAVQTMHNAKQQQHALPSHHPHPVSAPVPVEAPRASSSVRLPQNQSPPPVPAAVIFGPGPCRSKGSSPVVLSNMGIGSVAVSASTSAPAPLPIATSHTKPSFDHTDVVSNGTADAKTLRAHKQRSLSGGSESGFAAAAAAAAQKLTQNAVHNVPLHSANHHPHPPQPHKPKNIKSALDGPESSPLSSELLPVRMGASAHEPPEDEELVRAYMESQQQSQSGRSANAPHSDIAPTPSIHGRSSTRGGAVPPNEKMFAVSPGSTAQYSRSATPASLGPRQSSHSPSDNAFTTQPVPPQRSQSSTPSQMASRPHSRTSSASGSLGAGVPLHDEPGDANTLSHARAVNGATNRGSSTPSGRLRKQKPDGPAAAQLMDPTYSLPTQLRERQVYGPAHGRVASKDNDRSASPGAGASVTASTTRSTETSEQDSRVMRSLAQQSPSLLVCVPKSLPLQQPRCVKTHDDNSIAHDGDGSSVNDSDLESMSRAGAVMGGGLDQVLSSLRLEQQHHRMLYSVSSSSRDNLVPSPFSAFDELSQGSQSLSSNLSLSKQRPHRAATSSSGSHLSIPDDHADSRGTKPSRGAAVAETNGKKQHRLRKDP